MNPDGDALHDRIGRGMVHITIEGVENMAGLIIDRTTHSIYSIADARYFVGNIGVKPIYVEVQGQKKLCHHDCFLIQNGIVGIRCDFDDEIDSRAQKIEMSHRPVQLSESIQVYEGVKRTLTPGSVTGIERFDRHRFSVNCNLTYYVGYGALVINKDGQLVGICCSDEYHITARSISALLGTIKTIRDVLYK